MKQFFFNLFSICFALVLTTSCGEDNEDITMTPTNNLVQVAQEAGFTSLAAALTKAGLVDDLQGNTDLTVFAPTNDAFTALEDATGLVTLLTTDEQWLGHLQGILSRWIFTRLF